LAVGVALILYALTNDIAVALISGALAGLIAVHYSRARKEGFEDVEEDFEDEEEKKPKKKAAKKAKKAPAPDNGSRGEFFEPGKKYKMPSEKDDKEFHLDAGTTFMNAYKSLKPDQIAAMTKDTQELMDTQKQLMATLNTLKPLMQDGKDMMNTFQNYFGSSGVPTST
jgi:cell division protein ZapA (FtsZ GTPase activity inhibitor)